MSAIDEAAQSFEIDWGAGVERTVDHFIICEYLEWMMIMVCNDATPSSNQTINFTFPPHTHTQLRLHHFDS